jgi:hypothetical protein
MGTEDSRQEPFFMPEVVGKGWYRDILRKSEVTKARWDTLIIRSGKRASEIYRKLGIDKADWSRIVWGVSIPPIEIRLKIAEELETDSGILWSLGK